MVPDSRNEVVKGLEIVMMLRTLIHGGLGTAFCERDREVATRVAHGRPIIA